MTYWPKTGVFVKIGKGWCDVDALTPTIHSFSLLGILTYLPIYYFGENRSRNASV